MQLSDLPAVNATLNAASAVLITLGYGFIRRGNRNAHRNCMAAAVITSTAFLTCYLIYHFQVGRTEFHRPEWFRPIYLTLLATHTLMAVAVVPLVLLTVRHAIRARFDDHRRMARWTLPIWLYVSVTGVLIYYLLYHRFPQT